LSNTEIRSSPVCAEFPEHHSKMPQYFGRHVGDIAYVGHAPGAPNRA
jgi:hypothetical protein